MKTKDKKAKALDFMKKYQFGGNTNDYQMQNPYQYDPNLAVAQQNQILAPPLNQLNAAKSQSAYQPQPSFLDSAIPFISPAINLGIGVANIFSSIKEKSRQKAYERAFRKDLENRKIDARFNDFYATPYSVSSGSNRSGAPGYQVGGQVDNALNQVDNQMQMFIDYYNNQEQGKQNLDQEFQNYYNQKNDQMEQSWKSKRASGFNSLLSGAMSAIPLLQKGGKVDTIDSLRNELKIKYEDIDMEKAKSLHKMSKNTDQLKDYMKIVNGANPEDLKIGFHPKKFRFREKQEGGEINSDMLNPVIDPTQDLYSPEYKVPTEVEDEVSQVQIEAKEDDAIMSWLFEDTEDPYQEEVNQAYFSEESTEVIDQIGQQESGGNYEAQNPYGSATGKYQFTNQWAGQIKSFMGLPDSFTRNQVMQAFKKSPQSQEQFMKYVTENIYKPEVEKLRPLASKFGLDDNKLIRMLHYRGLGDTRKRLQTGNFEVSQAEKDRFHNPDILTYLNK